MVFVPCGGLRAGTPSRSPGQVTAQPPHHSWVWFKDTSQGLAQEWEQTAQAEGGEEK